MNIYIYIYIYKVKYFKCQYLENGESYHKTARDDSFSTIEWHHCKCYNL